MTQLNDNTGRLKDGAAALHDGAAQLADGSKQVRDGMTSMDAGIGTADPVRKDLSGKVWNTPAGGRGRKDAGDITCNSNQGDRAEVCPEF